nr:hypothetical protein CFP56_50333 [Quercus suber]
MSDWRVPSTLDEELDQRVSTAVPQRTKQRQAPWQLARARVANHAPFLAALGKSSMKLIRASATASTEKNKGVCKPAPWTGSWSASCYWRMCLAIQGAPAFAPQLSIRGSDHTRHSSVSRGTVEAYDESSAGEAGAGVRGGEDLESGVLGASWRHVSPSLQRLTT